MRYNTLLISDALEAHAARLARELSARSVKVNMQCLVELSLRGNALGLAHPDAVSEATDNLHMLLEKCRGLKHLDLSSNHLHDNIYSSMPAKFCILWRCWKSRSSESLAYWWRQFVRAK